MELNIQKIVARIRSDRRKLKELAVEKASLWVKDTPKVLLYEI